MPNINTSLLVLISWFQIYNGVALGEPLRDRMSDPSMDSMFNPTFAIHDLIDNLDMMMPNFNYSAEEYEELDNDIPGMALDPEDYAEASNPELDLLKTPISDEAIDPILGDYFEGDIPNVDVAEIRAMYDTAANELDGMRNAIKDEWRKWPGGVIPYVISSRYSRYERSIIAKAMKEYKDKTCIR